MQIQKYISSRLLPAFFAVALVASMSSLFVITVSQSASAKVSSAERKEAKKVWRNAKKGKIKFTIIHPDDNRANTTPRKNIASIAHGKEALTTQNCAGRGAGKPGPYSDVSINLKVLKFMNALAKRTNYGVTSIVGQCHSTGSAHYYGNAIDLSCKTNKLSRADIRKAKKIAKRYGMIKNSENCTARGGYHHHFEVI